MSSESPAAIELPLAEGLQDPPKPKQGCQGCLRKGCGCFGLVLLFCVAIAFWPLSYGGSSPSVFAYLPSPTQIAYRTEFIEFAEGSVHPSLSVEFREWVIGLARKAEQEPTELLHLSLDQKLSQAVMLLVPSSAAVLEANREASYPTEEVGGLLMYLVDNKPSEPEFLGIAAIKNDMIVAGDSEAVRRVLAVASGQDVSLFEARRDLRPILSMFSDSQVVVFTFQPREIAKPAGCLGGILGRGNPLFSLVGVRGHAFGSRKDEERCDVSIAFQYGSRVPSSVVTGVFGIFSTFNAIPVGIPAELGTPLDMDAEQERGVAMLTAAFDVEKCDDVDRKNRQQPQP